MKVRAHQNSIHELPSTDRDRETVNGDGIDDFVFSAPDAPGSPGKSYVIYGDGSPFSDFAVTSLPTGDRFLLTGANPLYQLSSVASDAGDFDGDGVFDILFGSPTVNTDQGSVLLIYGGSADFAASSMAASQGIKLTGASLRDLLGSSLSSLQDMNGDGKSEILVGAPGYSYNKGVMYLLFGRNDDPSTINLDTFTATDGFKIIGNTADGLFGSSVRDIGDINGDGAADFIIGAPGSGATGKAHVVFGVNAWACDTCDTFKTCQACKPGYDYTWNGVCYKDCPVQAPYKLNWECFATDPIPPPDPVRGDITLSDTVATCKGFTIANSAAGNKQFAYAVNGGGDFNGDGIPDIIISDYQYPSPSTIYLIYGKSTGYTNVDVNTMTTSDGFKITGLQIFNDDNSNFISLQGDLDGDSKADLIIGASQADSGAGAVYVIYGGTGYTNFPISSLPSSAAKISGAGGWNVDTRADINGDNLADIIFSSKGTASSTGSIYVVYGSPTRLSTLSAASITSPTGFRITGSALSSYLGTALAGVGDFNGDTFHDFTFTVPGALSNQGQAYAIYGTGSTVTNVVLTSLAAANSFKLNGASPISIATVASGAGDFNGDGFSDILYASPHLNTNQGTVLLIYGASGDPADFGVSGMTPSQGLKLTGVSLRDLLGSSLSSLPDMDGDGISEILVGAPGYSYNKGVMYLLFGRDDDPSTINLDTFTADDGFKILGSTTNGLLGSSVRDLGDINGDGVADFIIGAPGTGSNGRAHIVFGVNAWGCDTCNTFKTCQACKPGYDFTWNGVCYKDCPVHAPYKLNWECFSVDPIPPPDLVRGDITLSDTVPACKGFTITNSAAGNKKFAYAVDGGGDFNGDEIPDIAVSTYDDVGTSTVYVIYGRNNGYTNIDVNTMSTTDGFQITGLQILNDDNSNFISIAGDLDNDGKADLVIGASQADSGAGAVYVIYGDIDYANFDISTPPLTVIKISGAGGWNVNTRADINGDKINDLIISSKAADSNDGAVYVIYGSQPRLSSFNILSTPLIHPTGFKISGATGSYLGTALTNTGDFNGDGIDDVAVSAPDALLNQGMGYVIYGQGSRLTDFPMGSLAPGHAFSVAGENPMSMFRISFVASDAGDFNCFLVKGFFKRRFL